METADSRDGGAGDVSSRRVATPASLGVDVDYRVCVAAGRVVATPVAEDFFDALLTAFTWVRRRGQRLRGNAARP